MANLIHWNIEESQDSITHHTFHGTSFSIPANSVRYDATLTISMSPEEMSRLQHIFTDIEFNAMTLFEDNSDEVRELQRENMNLRRVLEKIKGNLQ